MFEEFIEEVERLREDLVHCIEPYGIPLSDFENAGTNGIFEIHSDGISREDSVFANDIFAKISSMPLEAIQSICLASAYLLAGSGAIEKKIPYGPHFLMKAAEELGYLRGMAFGVLHEHEFKRSMLVEIGRKGAKKKHGPATELKNWAIGRAKEMRGSDMDIARKLEKELPERYQGVSQDPRRLIYDAIRAERNNTFG